MQASTETADGLRHRHRHETGDRHRRRHTTAMTCFRDSPFSAAICCSNKACARAPTTLRAGTTHASLTDATSQRTRPRCTTRPCCQKHARWTRQGPTRCVKRNGADLSNPFDGVGEQRRSPLQPLTPATATPDPRRAGKKWICIWALSHACCCTCMLLGATSRALLAATSTRPCVDARCKMQHNQQDATASTQCKMQGPNTQARAHLQQLVKLATACQQLIQRREPLPHTNQDLLDHSLATNQDSTRPRPC